MALPSGQFLGESCAFLFDLGDLLGELLSDLLGDLLGELLSDLLGELGELFIWQVWSVIGRARRVG